jgi:putative FmdB family regulatory protein
VPIYEYACSSCAHRFEMQQKLSDQPVRICIKCGAEVTKIISAPAIMFKGSGWYVTDYSDKMKPPSGAETEGKAAEGKKSDSASKPAATTGESAPATGNTAAPASSTGGTTSSNSPATTAAPSNSSNSSGST